MNALAKKSLLISPAHVAVSVAVPALLLSYPYCAQEVILRPKV